MGGIPWGGTSELRRARRPPQGGTARAKARDDGKCHREHTAQAPLRRGEGKGEKAS